MATGVYLSSHKKKRTALLLCIFTGVFGGHYFFLCGKIHERSACNVHLQLLVYRMAARYYQNHERTIKG